MSQRQTSSRGSKTTSIAPSKTTFSALPDAAIFEILSKTDNPKELIRACAINKQYAEYCAKHKEQINKAQMLRKYPYIGKIMEHPYTFLNIIIDRSFVINKLISLGATKYMDYYGIAKFNSWKDNFENLGVLITMFDADPNVALSTMLTEHWTTVEQFKEVFKFVKAVQPNFKLEESLLQDIIKFYLRPSNAEKYVEILKFVLPEYKSLSAKTIGKAFLTSALERDLDLLWSFLIKLDPKTINDIVNEEDKETLLDVLLDKHFTIPDDTPSLRAQRKERFLLQLLSQNPNVNIEVDGRWTSAQTAFTKEISPTLTDTVLLEILKRADLNMEGLDYSLYGFTVAHLAFSNDSISEKVYLALLKRKPDLNLRTEDTQFTPAFLAFFNSNIPDTILSNIIQNFPKTLSTMYEIEDGTKTVSKTLEQIIIDRGKGYLLNEIRPVKSTQPVPSAQPSSSTQPAPSTRSRRLSNSSLGGERRTRSTAFNNLNFRLSKRLHSG